MSFRLFTAWRKRVQYLLSRANMEERLRNLEFPSYWVQVSGLRIHYKCLGTGPPVIMIHGGGNDWHEWQKNLAFIAQKFRVYALDLPGFGLSQPPGNPVSPFWSIVFLKSFIENLGISKTHLIGHSMGAMFCIVFAAHHPEYVQKMVLTDPFGLGKISRKARLLIFTLRTLDRWQGKKRGPEYLTGLIEEWLVLDQLPKIKSPVLLLWGQNDRYVPVSQCGMAQKLIPNKRLHIFPQCGHAPQREYPDQFNNLTLRFLASED